MAIYTQTLPISTIPKIDRRIVRWNDMVKLISCLDDALPGALLAQPFSALEEGPATGAILTSVPFRAASSHDQSQ